METLILNCEIDENVQKAGEILQKGGLVAIPTETVYGLAANALNPKAVKDIYVAKGRPSDNPLIVHIAEFKDIYPLVKDVPEVVEKLAEKFWGGPLTIILEKSSLIPNETSGGLDTVAIRIPANEIARKIIKAANCPLAAPSANISGKPSPTSFEHVFGDMNTRIDAIIKSDDCSVGVESTVITLATNPPKILRPGAVSFEDLKEFIPDIQIDKAVLEHVDNAKKVASPGMKYQHYSPKAKITLSFLSFEDYKKYLSQNKQCTALCFNSEKNELETQLGINTVNYGEIYNSNSQAQGLFSALHEIDDKNFDNVIARAPKKNGVGLAVYNRIIRAAGFNVIKPDVKIIGLTGPTGSGKSTVGKELEKLNCVIIDCDKISRDPKTYEGECLNKLKDTFGQDIANDNVLNRKVLAQRAFSSKENTQKLNDITLPVISEKINKIIEQYKNSGEKIIVLDAPTLFEAGADRYCTHILAVTANDDLRFERILKRDGITSEHAKARMNSQKNNEFYAQRADFVINTDNNQVDINQLKLFLERD